MEIGDGIRLAELVWRVWEIGWGQTTNASQEYHEFGQDIKRLLGSVRELEQVFDRTYSYLSQEGVGLPGHLTLQWDRPSFLDIIGDYEATVRECERLLETNRAYSSAAGPCQNITWHMFVRNDVERLRKRIQFHHVKIQHFLAPFEMDIRFRMQREITRAISELHDDVLGMRDDIRAMSQRLFELAQSLDPSLVQNSDGQLHSQQERRLDIPPDAQLEFDRMFNMHPDMVRSQPGRGPTFEPPLHDLANAFIGLFDASTGAFQPTNGNSQPTERQYLALLASQYIMARIMSCRQYSELPRHSHWPTYIRTLNRKLSRECQRCEVSMVRPPIRDLSLVPRFWPTVQPPPPVAAESVRVPQMMEYLLELPIINKRWRNLKLFRYCDQTDRRFRLVLTAAGTEPRIVDFDISRSSLVPLYASYEGTDSPFEVVLKARNEMHSLKFEALVDVFKFQQALTGYEVVDNVMGYRLQIAFISSTQDRTMEWGSMQLWRIGRVEGEKVTSDPDAWVPFNDNADHEEWATQSISSDPTSNSGGSSSSGSTRRLSQAQNYDRWSTPTAVTEPGVDPWSRQNSVDGSFRMAPPTSSSPQRHVSISGASYRSSPIDNRSPSWRHPSPRTIPGRMSLPLHVGTSTEPPSLQRPGSLNTFVSNATFATRTLTIGGAATLATTGMLHSTPTEPMLVLFTRTAAGHNAIVALTIEDKVCANYKACRCWDNMSDCRITALERSEGSRPLDILRLGSAGTPASTFNGEPQWDLLPLAEVRRGQRWARQNASRKAWANVVRVSICHDNQVERIKFSGYPCACPDPTGRPEAELMNCLGAWHRGRLGSIKEWFRRESVEWSDNRYHKSGSVIQTDVRR